MLNVGTLTPTQSSNIFKNSDSVSLVPIVSAEWNHNLFNYPYITTAGNGTKISGTPSGTISDVTVGAKENFVTKSFQMSNGTGSVSYTFSSLTGKAYKVITYVKSNSSTPIMISSYANSSVSQAGSAQAEVSSLGWTKIITYVGSSKETDTLSSFTYKIVASIFAEETENPTVFFTLPEVYETTVFDYKNGSLFPTDTVFSYFRPGESYVSSGNKYCSLPLRHRRIASKVKDGEAENTIDGTKFFGTKYMPLTPIIQNPSFFLASPPVAVLKTALPTDINPYKYFVSDSSSKSITAIYEKNLITNKIVIKTNTLMTVPTFNLYINNSLVTVDAGTANATTSISPSANADGYNTGLIVLYWTGTTWSKNPWETMTEFQPDGSLNNTTTVNKITLTQISRTINTPFTSFSGSSVTNDLNRMHLIELSPRLEIDLSSFVVAYDLEKSLDAKDTVLPISSMNSNDISLTFSGIPLTKNGEIVPIFSNQSNNSLTILSNMLRNNIKFYVSFNLQNSAVGGTSTTSYTNTYIPSGVFYSDAWTENDTKEVTVQAYDISRYLQSRPAPDYVANLKTVFEIITNILDLSGFTDYDYDSLHKICNNKAQPVDMAYYYCNSRDVTLIEALNQIFIAYQIGAYIDEYGIMRFLSLYDILSDQVSSLSISDSDIMEGGLTVANQQKPGKISLRYQSPKVKQSPSLQNVKDIDIKNSPAFIYTTSNDVVWQQQSIDSVGFNYLKDDMDIDSTNLNINTNDLRDIFHTFNRDANGYVSVEGEIMSFEYKQYIISKADGTQPKTVSIKNNNELSGAINDYIKEYSVGLQQKSAIVTDAEGDGVINTYYAENNFSTGDRVIISGMIPTNFNLSGIVMFEPTPTQFEILTKSHSLNPVTKAGTAVTASTSDTLITPTGNITNVQRGMFGTTPRNHSRITTLQSKGLEEKLISSSYVFSNNTSGLSNIIITNSNEQDDKLPNVTKLGLRASGTNKTVVRPAVETTRSYKTYSVKFDILDQYVAAAGLYINQSSVSSSDPLFVELIKFSKTNSQGFFYEPPKYTYMLAIYDQEALYAYTDVTGECNTALNKLPKIFKENSGATPPDPTYSYVFDPFFNLRVVLNQTDGSDGENGTIEDPATALSIFLNDVEVIGWQVPDTSTSDADWTTTNLNDITKIRQKPSVPKIYEQSKSFGFYASIAPKSLPGIIYPEPTFMNYVANLREIHATEKPLLSRSAGYFYQDQEFLNGMVQNQPLASNSLTYIVQTTPEISGINYYDVQYSTPAAVSVDVFPIQYMMSYFPGGTKEEQSYKQKKLVTEDSLSYSTPLNTGFRARMAIANSSPHMVFLTKESDEVIKVAVNLNLWTHEIVAPSEPEILEALLVESNGGDTAQLDSQWIQSKSAARKMLRIVEMGVDGFSTKLSLSIFGNPLIQIGDVVTVSYALNGMLNQKYLVTSVSQSFDSGLSTTLGLSGIK